MVEARELMDYISSSKEDIARAIALAFSEGDEDKADAYFPVFLERIANSKIFIFDSKNNFSRYNFGDKLAVRKIFLMVKKYNVQCLDDIMNFYNEICSCLVDVSKLSEEEKMVVEENKNKLIKRLKDKSVIGNLSKVRQLKKMIENVYENEYFKSCLSNSNIEDFFARCGIAITKNNLKQVVFLYNSSFSGSGFNTRIKFDEGVFNVSIFGDSILQNGSMYRNELIIHEAIHSIENYGCCGFQYPFNDKCRYLNEVMTQHFCLEAINFLDKSHLKNDGENGNRFHCSYNFMLPMLLVLKNSSLWDDLLYCKLTNDYSMFINKIGNDAFKIGKIFDKVYSYRKKDIIFKQDKVEEAIEILKKIVRNVNCKNIGYNKNK